MDGGQLFVALMVILGIVGAGAIVRAVQTSFGRKREHQGVEAPEDVSPESDLSVSQFRHVEAREDHVATSERNTPSRFVPYRVAESIDQAQEVADEVDDNGYSEFVDETWRALNAVKLDVTLERVNDSGESVVSRVCSIVPRHDNTRYVNTIEGGVRKTYVNDRHKWRRDGLDIDSSAFSAIRSGLDPDRALRFTPYPLSVEAALSAEDNHFQTDRRSYVIGYRDGEGRLSYRAVSGIRRGPDRFSAHCHFRWGDLRHFLYSRLEEVIDAETGEVISVEKFSDLSAPLKTHGRPRRSGQSAASHDDEPQPS